MGELICHTNAYFADLSSNRKNADNVDRYIASKILALVFPVL